MRGFAIRLAGAGEFVDGQALAPEGAFVRYDGEGRRPVTDGPFVGLQIRQASPVVSSARADVVKIAVLAPLAALSAVFEAKTAILL
jgi:hypothetical protein